MVHQRLPEEAPVIRATPGKRVEDIVYLLMKMINCSEYQEDHMSS